MVILCTFTLIANDRFRNSHVINSCKCKVCYLNTPLRKSFHFWLLNFVPLSLSLSISLIHIHFLLFCFLMQFLLYLAIVAIDCQIRLDMQFNLKKSHNFFFLWTVGGINIRVSLFLILLLLVLFVAIVLCVVALLDFNTSLKEQMAGLPFVILDNFWIQLCSFYVCPKPKRPSDRNRLLQIEMLGCSSS